MRTAFYLFLAVVLTGCVTINAPTEVTDKVSYKKILIPVEDVTSGMSKNDVSVLLGKGVVIGFERDDENQKSFRPITINNPYRTEILGAAPEKYDVLFYFFAVVKPDGVVAEEELMPLIFQDGELVSKGWEAYRKLKKENQ